MGAPVMPRNYMIMEVKSNLVATERQETLKKFNYPCYKKVAKVVMGEPTAEFKSIVQSTLLKDKQHKANQAWHVKKAESGRKKELARMRKAAEKSRKEAQKKKEAEAAAKKKKEEEEKKAKEAAEK